MSSGEGGHVDAVKCPWAGNRLTDDGGLLDWERFIDRNRSSVNKRTVSGS